MTVSTARFGDIAIEECRVLTFPEGLPGFDRLRRFALVPHHAPPGKGSPFIWLQSLDDGALAFLAMEPHQCFPDYAPRVPRAEMEELGLTGPDARPRLYVLLTVPPGRPLGITANLTAPVLLNTRGRLGRQVVLKTDQYGLRHPLLPAD